MRLYLKYKTNLNICMILMTILIFSRTSEYLLESALVKQEKQSQQASVVYVIGLQIHNNHLRMNLSPLVPIKEH